MTPEEIKNQWNKTDPPILDGEIIVECEDYWADEPRLTEKVNISKPFDWLLKPAPYILITRDMNVTQTRVKYPDMPLMIYEVDFDGMGLA